MGTIPALASSVPSAQAVDPGWRKNRQLSSEPLGFAQKDGRFREAAGVQPPRGSGSPPLEAPPQSAGNAGSVQRGAAYFLRAA